MPLTLTSLPPRAGIFVYEQTAGPTPPALALYRRTYLLGSASMGDGGEAIPIGSLDDFDNTFGSKSAIVRNSIEAYLKNTKQGLFYRRVLPYPVLKVTLIDASPTFSLEINSVALTVPRTTGSTLATLLASLVTTINDTEALNTVVEAEFELDDAGAHVFSNAFFWLRSKNGKPITVTNLQGMTVKTTSDELKYWDYLRTLEDLAEDMGEEPLGFVCCPQAFYELTHQHERTVVGNTLEAAARQLGWMALLDPGHPDLITSPLKAKADSDAYVAPRGHSAYYFPYAVDSDDDDVAPSVLVAAFAMQRYEQEGIHKPPAGPGYPFIGISGLRYALKGSRLSKSASDLDFLASNRINPLLYKRGVGFVPFDSYTRSTNTNFRHISTRVILSIIERSIQDTLDSSGLLFDAIGSRGIFFLKIKNTIEGVLARFYEGDALYGIRPEDAYTVICDSSIQDSADLEQGIIHADVYCVPAGTARQIRVNVFRVQIGKMNQALTSAVQVDQTQEGTSSSSSSGSSSGSSGS